MIELLLLQVDLDLAMLRGGADVAGGFGPAEFDRGHLVLGLLGAVGLTAALGDIIRRDLAMHGAAFRRLALELGLSRCERRFLKRLAASAGLPSPACLLVSRGCFDHAAASASVGGDGEAAGDLRRRLYGGAT